MRYPPHAALRTPEGTLPRQPAVTEWSGRTPSKVVLGRLLGRGGMADIQPILTDFGIARIAGADTQMAAESLLGTPAYMSPEQARGAPIDPRSDVYSLGVVLYEMLAGRLPFEAGDDTPVSVLLKHISDPVSPIADTDPSIQAIVNRVLAKDPSERFQSAGELACALTQAIATAAAAPVPPQAARPPAVHPTARRRPTTLQWAAVAGAGLVALVLGALGLRALIGSLVPPPSPTAGPVTPSQPSVAPTQPLAFVTPPDSEAPLIRWSFLRFGGGQSHRRPHFILQG